MLAISIIQISKDYVLHSQTIHQIVKLTQRYEFDIFKWIHEMSTMVKASFILYIHGVQYDAFFWRAYGFPSYIA